MSIGDIQLILTHLKTLWISFVAVSLVITVAFAILIKGGKAKETGENVPGAVEEQGIQEEKASVSEDALLT